MSQLAERWTPPSSPNWTYEQDEMSEVLYALIEQNATVSAKALSAIAPSFPNQALILAARLPLSKVTPLLEKWYYAGENNKIKDSKKDLNDWNRSELARVSAMMLSKAPPPGFAASILARSEEHFYIFVTNEKGPWMGGGGGIGSCGDGGGGRPPDGWPPLFFYDIEENKPKTRDPLLVAAGGDRITWRTISISTGWGSCFGVHSLDDENRYHLLAALLGRSENQLAWKLRDQTTIYWESNPKYLLDLQSVVHSEEAKFEVTIGALRKKRLLTTEDAGVIRPELLITISDHRKPPVPPLPQPIHLDPRTRIVAITD